MFIVFPFLGCTKNAPKCSACECFNVYFHQSQSISHTEMKEDERSWWPITQIHLLLRESQPFSALPCNYGTGQNVLRRWTSPGWRSIFAPMMQLQSKALRTSCSQHLVKEQTLKCCASFNFKPQIWSYTSWPMNPSSPKCSYLNILNFHMFPKLEIGPEQRRDLFANRHPSRPRHESISPSRSLSLSPSAMGARQLRTTRLPIIVNKNHRKLVGGWTTHLKKCSSNWIISPNSGEHKKSLSCHHLEKEWIEKLPSYSETNGFKQP